MSELRWCPFCGGEAYLHIHERYGIECDNCGMGLGCICDTEEEAIKRWNRREPMDKIVEQLEEKADIANDNWGFHRNNSFGSYFDGEEDGIRSAIEIVKKGGAE